jgi:Flp pilus assembly protein TadG
MRGRLLPKRKQAPSSAGRWQSGGERGSVSAETAIATPVLVAVLLFVGVLVARGVDSRLRVDDAAHQAARAASLSRTPDHAITAATRTAEEALSGAGATCRRPAVTVDISQFRAGGVVSVTVTCHLDLSHAALLDLAGGKTISATATSPIDTWRALVSGSSGGPS